jgi:hypothetical protein
MPGQVLERVFQAVLSSTGGSGILFGQIGEECIEIVSCAVRPRDAHLRVVRKAWASRSDDPPSLGHDIVMGCRAPGLEVSESLVNMGDLPVLLCKISLKGCDDVLRAWAVRRRGQSLPFLTRLFGQTHVHRLRRHA